MTVTELKIGQLAQQRAPSIPARWPRTAAEARQWCEQANGAARSAIARRAAEHQAAMRRLDDSGAAVKAEQEHRRRGGALNAVEIYRRLNGDAR